MNKKNKLPEINEENEKEYWAEYQKTLSPQIREAIVKKYSEEIDRERVPGNCVGINRRCVSR